MSADASGAGSTSGGQRLLDEALRLVEALRDAGAAADRDGTGGPAAAPTGGLGAEHSGPECRVCPVCRVVAAVRALRPEAVEHLAVAAAELASAWREVVAATPPTPASAPPRGEPPVERIDVTD
ncbi:MAG: hypothetical protein ACKVZ6_21360 [Kineosporiaceae bacterium]